MHTDTKNPEEMSAEERLQEIAAMLADLILRKNQKIKESFY